MKKLLFTILALALFLPSQVFASTIQVLAVGGGGGGGNFSNSGGGGGGEFEYNSAFTVTLGTTTTYTVTVGAGGAAGTFIDSSAAQGATGGSTIFGSITAVGGAGGGYYNSVGANGGNAGGGGTGYNANASSTGTQGGGNSCNPVSCTSSAGAGGGGGATAVGGTGTSARGGTGGAGTANSITGSSVTYAGGGGGGADTGTRGAGGAGGGGQAELGGDNAAAVGTANTGGGGGGSASNAHGGGKAGGSGVVIISYVTASYASSSYSGAGNYSYIDGANTVVVFVASGLFAIWEDRLVQLNGFTGIASAIQAMTSAGSNLVWTSINDGYTFYAGSAGDYLMSSTTDGGITWSTGRQVDSVNTTDIVSGSVWYDRWTQTDTTGNIIHIATTDTSVDDIYYTTLDLSTGAFSTSVVATTQGATCARTGVNCGANITKAENGVLYVTTRDGSDSWVASCSTTCTTSGNWSERTGAFTGVAANGDDPITIAPVAGTNNVMYFMLDTDAAVLYSRVYSATSSTWWGLNTVSTAIEGGGQLQGQSVVAFTYSPTSDVMYFYAMDSNTGSADTLGKAWSFTPSTYAWSALTNATTTTKGVLIEGKLAIDDANSIIHYIYTWRSTGNNPATTYSYLTSSTDGGSTWTASSTEMSKGVASTFNLTTDPFTSTHLGSVYKYLVLPDQDDLFYRRMLIYAAAGGGGGGDNYQERQNIIWDD